MSAAPRVLLIVVNWNGRAYLEDCLSSLAALDYADFTVVVVDNASTDGSLDFVRECFPKVELICSPHNLGYGGGANLALRTCRAEVAVVLNTDISVPPDWLARLIAPLMDDPTIGIAGSKLYYPGGQTLQHAGGYITAPQAWPGHYGLHDEDQGQHDVLRDVDYVIGAALAVKRTTLEQIGLFDEGYFLYYEDVDLCLRARRAGQRVVYIPDAWLTHLESVTTIKGSAAYLQQFFRGRWRFILKHYIPAEILRDSLPAERAWLMQCGPAERQAAAVAYRSTLEVLPEICLARMRDGSGQVQPIGAEEQTLIADQLLTLLEVSQQAPEPLPMPEAPQDMNTESFDPATPLSRLRLKQRLQEQPFVSHAPVIGPLIARLRAAWNSVSTKWYVRSLLQQQNEFNELTVNQLVVQDAYIQHHEARLGDQEARLGDQEARLGDHARRLDEQIVGLTDLSSRFTTRAELQESRVHDHDSWLIAQDREQSDLVHDLAEIRLQLVQMNRLLQDLNERLGRLEASDLQQRKERVA